MSLRAINTAIDKVAALIAGACKRKVWDPFATHLPVLLAVSSLVRAERILEFGSGVYSTLTFLDRRAFPHLQLLHSFDNDSKWSNKFGAMAAADSRLQVTFVPGAVSSAVGAVRFQDYDLVFVDDSATIPERTETIGAVSLNCAASNIVIIHDFEREPYRSAASAIPHRFTFDALLPQTGILWTDAPLRHDQLEKLNVLIGRQAQKLGPQHLVSWLKCFSKGKEGQNERRKSRLGPYRV